MFLPHGLRGTELLFSDGLLCARPFLSVWVCTLLFNFHGISEARAMQPILQMRESPNTQLPYRA